MNKQLDKQLQLTKQSSKEIAKLSAKKKEELLLAIARNVEKHKKQIFAANAQDIATTKATGATTAFIDRLTLSEKGFAAMMQQLKVVAHVKDVIGEIIEKRKLTNGIRLQKIRFPIGVIAMIYESRPNITVDIAGLCLKSGTAVILKGGSEAAHTNRVLVTCIHEVLERFDIAKKAVAFLDNASHETVEEMLTRNDIIDLVIPRGSYGLTTMVAKKSRIPILYHARGGARMYVDKSANIQQALKICINAKTNRTGVCNALDTVLVHKDVAERFLPILAQELWKKGFEIRADKKSLSVILNLFQDLNDKRIVSATEEDFSTEFLDTILAVKVVSSAEEAIAFIQLHTHGHTEVLAAKDKKVIDTFIKEVDAAGLMINCSSRLHDGGEFGMGAEMGIATGKLHARGPVGIRELTTYKWVALGSGQVKE